MSKSIEILLDLAALQKRNDLSKNCEICLILLYFFLIYLSIKFQLRINNLGILFQKKCRDIKKADQILSAMCVKKSCLIFGYSPRPFKIQETSILFCSNWQRQESGSSPARSFLA